VTSYAEVVGPGADGTPPLQSVRRRVRADIGQCWLPAGAGHPTELSGRPTCPPKARRPVRHPNRPGTLLGPDAASDIRFSIDIKL
jgi:hypothetical protein